MYSATSRLARPTSAAWPLSVRRSSTANPHKLRPTEFPCYRLTSGLAAAVWLFDFVSVSLPTLKHSLPMQANKGGVVLGVVAADRSGGHSRSQPSGILAYSSTRATGFRHSDQEP